MPLVNMRDMLNHAYEHGYVVGAFADDLFRAVDGERIGIDYQIH